MIQSKGSEAICSTIGDAEKHEKFKRLSKDKRIEKLQETYDRYGVLSNEFYAQVKPFVIWTIYRHLRGMSAVYYLEDLVNNAYEELVIAFNGGKTTHYNQEVYKEPIYGTDYYYTRYKNIGDFIMAVVGSSVAKYRSRTYRSKIVHEEMEDIYDKLGYTNFEQSNDLTYEQDDTFFCKYFSFFKVNDTFAKHLDKLQEQMPKDNVLYNFMMWRQKV